MPSIKVVGGKRLKGDVKIQGSKNASLPILAASILNKGITRLKNCPNIVDVQNMILILEELGCKVSKEKEVLIIDSKDINTTKISKENVSKMRSSILFLGALLARCRQATISFPGGCLIGNRPIDYHLDAFKKMNIKTLETDTKTINCLTNLIKGANIKLKFPSVGATQNIVIAAVLADGVTCISNAAKEPEVSELCLFLNAAGAKISGIGSSILKIEGVNKLYDVDYTLISDRIVAGTYISAVAASLGEANLHLAPTDHIKSIIKLFRKLGAKIDIKNDYLKVKCDRIKSVRKITTKPYPGFPTDMQSQIMSVLCISDGTTIVREDIFEHRFQNVDFLNKMGARIEIINKKEARICGVDKLYGNKLVSKDLRGGASLIIAGLIAEGESIIEGSKYIDRGYEDIVYDLKLLNANIDKVN